MKLYALVLIRDWTNGKVTSTDSIFDDLDEVTHVVKHNIGGLDEDGFFDYLVIEELETGRSIPRTSDARIWYTWSDGAWVLTDCPKHYRGIIGFWQ